MLPALSITLALAILPVTTTSASQLPLLDLKQNPLQAANTKDSIPYSTRAHWMRRANAALPLLSSPCPHEAFASVIVNHTKDTPDGLGELVCMGVNQIREVGDPVLHGEIQTIQNCTALLTSPEGPHKLTPVAALSAFKDLSLYTNGEPCPMCAAAIRWAGFKECIYGTSMERLIELGWRQFRLKTREVFEASWELSGGTRLVENVLGNETDRFFAWQFGDGRCPKGCGRGAGGDCEEL